MAAARRFSKPVLEALQKSKYVGVRAGREPHRFTHVWFALIDNRVFVRGYYLRERSWHGTFTNDPSGVMKIGDRQVPIRGIRTRSERLKDRVEEEYAKKYDTSSSRKYVRGFKTPARRATTTELVPR